MVVLLLVPALCLVAFLVVGAVLEGARSIDLGAVSVAIDPGRFAPTWGGAHLRLGLPSGP